MTYFPINGSIGFYDLRNYLIDKNKGRDELIFNYNLPQNIKLIIFNNFYYLFDFSEAEFAKPELDLQKFQAFKDTAGSITIPLQKEIINSFNACIYITQQKHKKNQKPPQPALSPLMWRAMMFNDIDQFFIPNQLNKENFLPFKDYLIDTPFSSAAYKTACEHVHNCKGENSILREDIIEESVILMKKLLKDEKIHTTYNQAWFYLLAQIWKIIYYKNHDLRVEAIQLSRSVFEVFVQRKFNKEKPNCKEYKEFCENDEINTFMCSVKNDRNAASHCLKSIEGYEALNNLGQIVKYLVDFFQRESNIKIEEINTK